MKWLWHHGKRILRISVAVVLIAVGAFLTLPGIPGPGLVVVFGGLSLLAVDFPWAHRLKLKIQAMAKKAYHKVLDKKQEGEQ